VKKLLMLQQEFIALVLKYTPDKELANNLWQEIESAYSQKERHFHNLSHIEQVVTALQPLHHLIDDVDTLLFAAYYHDVVYDVVQYVTDNNNEDKSADFVGERLQRIHYPAERIERCRRHILATKKHHLSSDGDTNFLTDADLSILGQQWEVYDEYRKNIRKEYDIYPDPIYHAGRMKVLSNFLQTEPLYKTEPFQQKFETAAAGNISRELELLSLL